MIFIQIITNNMMISKNINNVPVHYMDKEYIGVLYEVRRLIVDEHLTMHTHPLSSSLKPNETYYKSIVVSSKSNSSIDISSLDLIDYAIDVHDKFMGTKKRPQWTERILKDFALIDYDLIKSTLPRLQFAQ